MMEAIIEPFTEQVKRVRLKPPTIPYLSNLTGKWITSTEATGVNYWAQHLRRSVRFADGIGELLKEPEQVLLEVGPGQTLSALAKQHPQRSAQQSVITSLPRPDGARTEEASLLKALGQLWLAGIEVDWSGFYAAEQRQRVALPTYPFERQSYWIGLPPAIQQQQRPQPNGSLQSTGETGMPRTATIGKSSPAHKSMETVARSSQTAPPTALPKPTVSHSDGPPTMNANVEGMVMAKVSARERLVAQQLQIMNQQLAVLSSRRELKKS
jgi:acyl transferase domain-containing protein